MELRHLRYFAAVAEALSFSRASEKLRIAQPALSRQIRDLEREMGTLLIDRGHGRMHLTDAGRVFQAHVTRLLAQVDIAVTAAQEAERGHEGRLVICSDWQFAIGQVPECVRVFREKFPRVEIDLTELPIFDQLEALRAGDVHLCLVPRELIGARDGLETMTIVNSPLMVAVPASHRLAQQTAVRLIELEDESWTWVESGRARGHRTHLLQQCRLAGFVPRFAKPSTSLDGLIANVTSGGGITLVPQCVLPDGNTHLHTLATDCAAIEICAVWRRDETSHPLRAFVDLLRQYVG